MMRSESWDEELFSVEAGAGCRRIEGGLIVLVDWWWQVSGREEVESALDKAGIIQMCRVPRMAAPMAEKLKTYYGFEKAFLKAMRENPLANFALTAMRPTTRPSFSDQDNQHVLKERQDAYQAVVSERIALEVGRRVLSGWVARNDRELRKEAKACKIVEKVHAF